MDTAQPGMAAENVALAEAAEAFRLRNNPPPAQPRAPNGQFAPRDEPEQPEGETDQPEPEAGSEEELRDDVTDTGEAPEEGQPEPVELPPSWSKDAAEQWERIPPDVQAYIAQREGERETAVNAKFQESANARKLAEQQAAEANANRNAYAQLIDNLGALFNVPEPNPMDYGYGTPEYRSHDYDFAQYQWRQSQNAFGQLVQQRQAIAAQQAQEAAQAQAQRHAELEATGWPQFVETVPDVADAQKAPEIIRGLVDYAVKQGIPADVFGPGAETRVTSTEMKILWKANEYDKIKAAEKRVKAGNPQPKPATPAVKPGGQTNRQTIQSQRLGQAQKRLAEEGSIEAGAEVFKHLLNPRR